MQGEVSQIALKWHAAVGVHCGHQRALEGGFLGNYIQELILFFSFWPQSPKISWKFYILLFLLETLSYFHPEEQNVVNSARFYLSWVVFKVEWAETLWFQGETNTMSSHSSPLLHRLPFLSFCVSFCTFSFSSRPDLDLICTVFMKHFSCRKMESDGGF